MRDENKERQKRLRLIARLQAKDEIKRKEEKEAILSVYENSGNFQEIYIRFLNSTSSRTGMNAGGSNTAYIKEQLYEMCTSYKPSVDK